MDDQNKLTNLVNNTTGGNCLVMDDEPKVLDGSDFFALENRRKNMKAPILRKLGKYWLNKNVRFGEIIWKLHPKSIEEWQRYLVSKKYFFPKERTTNLGCCSKTEHNIWVHYLTQSFWSLYTSEKYFFKLMTSYIVNRNLNYRKTYGRALLSVLSFKRADFYLDCKFGVDFILNATRWYRGYSACYKYYFIVKSTHVSGNSFLRSKPAYHLFKQFQGKLDHYYHINNAPCASTIEARSLGYTLRFVNCSCDFHGDCERCHNHYWKCQCYPGLGRVIGNFVYLIHDCKPGSKVKTCFEFDWQDFKFKKMALSDIFSAELPLSLHRRPDGE